VEVHGTQHALLPPGMVVGRGSEGDLRIDDPGVSRRHAEFLVTASQEAKGGLHLEVHDMGSTNGIRVDGQKVARAVLRHGSTVQVGRTDLVVRLLEEKTDV
jgi:pSer/pThr/pTyr-binding forkhead associated (FHA) protein